MIVRSSAVCGRLTSCVAVSGLASVPVMMLPSFCTVRVSIVLDRIIVLIFCSAFLRDVLGLARVLGLDPRSPAGLRRAPASGLGLTRALKSTGLGLDMNASGSPCGDRLACGVSGDAG